MEPFLKSTLVVALAEIGDKTQLLSLLLAARYKKPPAIVLGILVATLANHFLAGLLGEWIRSLFAPDALRWFVGGSLIAMALWILKPDKLDGDVDAATRYDVFVLTVIAFFLAEMGDKTQIATIVLTAKYHALFAVVAGTTPGMLIANVPVVLVGAAASHRIPLRAVRAVTAVLFAALGVAALAGAGH